jgi:hypothetical protein
LGSVLDGSWLEVIGVISDIFIGGLSKHVVLWDVVFDEGFCVEGGNVNVVFPCYGLRRGAKSGRVSLLDRSLP